MQHYSSSPVARSIHETLFCFSSSVNALIYEYSQDLYFIKSIPFDGETTSICNGLACSNDGTLCAAAFGVELEIRDTKTGALRNADFIGDKEKCWKGLAFNPDSTVLYHMTEDSNMIDVWHISKNHHAKGSPVLESPRAICVHAFTNQLFVLDIDDDRIHVFDSQGSHQSHFDLLTAAKYCEYPFSMCLDSQNNEIYICNGHHRPNDSYQRIIVLDLKGNFKHGFGTAELQYPGDITLLSNGLIAVNDYPSNEIHFFRKDTSALVWTSVLRDPIYMVAPMHESILYIASKTQVKVYAV